MSNRETKFINSLKLILIVIIFNNYNVKSNHEKNPGIMYILLWSAINTEPFRFWSTKQKSLNLMNCKFQNCYIIKNREYFQDVTDYDAVLFTVKGLGGGENLPHARSDNQLYVFVSLESPSYYYFDERWNWFFNYTWTYKLDSDITHPYFIVRNKRGEVVGPKINARWKNITRMRPTQKSVIEKLKNKDKAAAWFVTNCHGKSKRLIYGHGLNRALNKFNLTVDIFGNCGNKLCSREKWEDCLNLIESRYYFYLSFENSVCEDYVTEKLVTALEHYAVPVVLGGANYSRFMPDGIYLNSNLLTEDVLAEKIYEIIQDKQKYYDYFRWHQYYTYQFTAESGDTDPLCSFCAFLNDESKRNQRRVYARFDKWWNEFRTQNDTEEIIVKFDDSGAHIKSIITYREENVEPKTITTPSDWQNVNSIFDDFINYVFPP